MSIAKPLAWESLGYGVFLHFGMSTFTGQEWDKAPWEPLEGKNCDVHLDDGEK